MLSGLFGGRKQATGPGGVLTLIVVEGRGLKPTALGLKRDAYVEARVVSSVPAQQAGPQKTPVARATCDPKFGVEMVWPVPRPSQDTLEIKLYDFRQLGNNELLGVLTVAVSSFFGRPFVDDWIALQDPARRGVVGATAPGALHVVVLYAGEGQPLPQLPPGWAAAYDQRRRVFYVNQFTGQTTWAPPMQPAVPAPTMQQPMAVGPPPPLYAEVAQQQQQQQHSQQQQTPPPPTVPGSVPPQPPQPMSMPPPDYEAAAAPQMPQQQQYEQQQQLYPAVPMPAPAGDDMPAVLTANGLSHLIPLFARERIDMQILRSMSETDMQQLGVESFGDRRRLLLLSGRQ